MTTDERARGDGDTREERPGDQSPAPAMVFHQIAEGGRDTPRLIEFTGRAAAFALLPFALGIGLQMYIVAQAVLGDTAAVPLGLAGMVFALIFWYGVEWIWRALDNRGGNAEKEQRVPEPTSLENKIKQVLTETRVVLPGAQALLGFQLTAMLTDAFDKLPKNLQYVHLGSLCLLAVSIVFLMSPAAFHRIVERGEDTERLYRFSSVMLLAAMLLGAGKASEQTSQSPTSYSATQYGARAFFMTLERLGYKPRRWRFDDGHLPYIDRAIDAAQREWVLPRKSVKHVSRVSESLRQAGLLGARPEGLWRR